MTPSPGSSSRTASFPDEELLQGVETSLDSPHTVPEVSVLRIHAVPEIPNLVVHMVAKISNLVIHPIPERGALPGRFSKLRTNGARLGQDEASESEKAATDR